jgi:hypothetical protein
VAPTYYCAEVRLFDAIIYLFRIGCQWRQPIGFKLIHVLVALLASAAGERAHQEASASGMPMNIAIAAEERTMRPIALGRRNSLFSGSTRGAEAWAILASIVNSAKLHDLDPQTDLADRLERILSSETKVSALHELLPWEWKAARAAALAAA